MFLSRSHSQNPAPPATGLSRRKSLALPFVMTAAAACTPKPAEEPSQVPAHGQEEATPVIISNPPRPQPVEADSAGGDTDARPAPATGTTAPAQPEPVIMRNPPPPRPARPGDNRAGTDVEAVGVKPSVKPTDTTTPKPLPKAPATGGHVQVGEDGSCWWHAAVECPPKTMCNPPPPKRVQCPEAK